MGIRPDNSKMIRIGTSIQPHPFTIIDNFLYQYLVYVIICVNLYINFQNLHDYSFLVIEENSE